MEYLHGRDRESIEVPFCEGCQAGVAGVEELDMCGIMLDMALPLDPGPMMEGWQKALGQKECVFS